MFSKVFLAVLAQSLSVSAATLNVAVGANNQLTFTPPTVQAKAGDMVAFNFQTANHSVVSSNQNSPCVPQQNAIFSGFQPVTAQNQNNKPTFSVPVTDTNPIYIYCSQKTHCQQGMVMIINPPNSTAQQLYAAKAQQGGTGVSPPGGISGGSIQNNAINIKASSSAAAAGAAKTSAAAKATGASKAGAAAAAAKTSAAAKKGN